MRTLTIALILFACGSPNDPQPTGYTVPKVESLLSNVTGTTATLGAKVTSAVPPAYEVGIIFGPAKIEGTEHFFTGLTPFKEYTFQAYAINAGGQGLGEKITFVAACTSDIGGTVTYSTVVTATGGVSCGTVTGSTFFSEFSEGQYLIGDVSFGLYKCAWNDSNAQGVILKDLCGEWSLSGTNQYGLSYLWDFEVQGENLIITWSNEGGDAGISTLKRTGGWD